MTNPESQESIVKRIAHDPQVLGYLHLVMQAGLIYPDQEFTITDEVCTRYAVDLDIFSKGCAIARAEIDEAILNGSISLL